MVYRVNRQRAHDGRRTSGAQAPPPQQTRTSATDTAGKQLSDASSMYCVVSSASAAAYNASAALTSSMLPHSGRKECGSMLAATHDPGGTRSGFFTWMWKRTRQESGHCGKEKLRKGRW